MEFDRISKPSKGRLFPLSKAELVKLIELHGFEVDDYYKRLPLFMENCEFVPELGAQVASFYRGGYLAVFSHPDSSNQALVKVALAKATEAFGKIDKEPRIATNEQQFLIYRAYLSTTYVLTITRHMVNAGTRWYLQYKGMAQRSKSQGKPTNEVVISRTELA